MAMNSLHCSNHKKEKKEEEKNLLNTLKKIWVMLGTGTEPSSSALEVKVKNVKAVCYKFI